MKKMILLLLPVTILFVLSGCLTTLHPIFTEKDLVAGSQLTGSWKRATDGSVTTYRKATKEDLASFSAILQQNAAKAYYVTVKSGIDNPTAVYYAFLVKLGNYFYLDYYPADSPERKPVDAFFKAQYIPMHSISRIDFNSNGSFELKQLDGGYLENLMRNKQIRIQHAKMDDGSYFITAPTAELQQYLIKYSDVAEAYDNSNSSSYTKIN